MARKQKIELKRKRIVIGQCMICNEDILEFQPDIRHLRPDDKCPDDRYYHLIKCGPGTKAWMSHFPQSEIARMLYEGIEREKKEKWDKLKKFNEFKKGSPKLKFPPQIKSREKPVIQLRERHREEKALRTIPKGGEFKPGSKVEFVYNVLKKGVTVSELQKILTEKWGEKTGGDANTKLYLNNVAAKKKVIKKGEIYYAE